MPELPRYSTLYGTLPSMLRKFDRYARQDAFRGESLTQFEEWSTAARKTLRGLLALEKMDPCPLQPRLLERVELAGGICREHWLIQTEPDVTMPFYLLIPKGAGKATRPFLCPPGHGGGGKPAVAGERAFSAVSDIIDHYNYDYGLQLAQLGYVALCPDARGFGERREDMADTLALPEALKGDCYRLAHMGEPLGIPVLGMLVWDLMRAADWLQADDRFDGENISALGFSGGGMQTLYLAALDDRIKLVILSGYLYGVRDALLTLNNNCSCNYVPHLWEHFDMGDIASLLAPRPLLVQSCREDRLNGPRGVENCVEQVDIARAAYRLYGAEGSILHELCPGTHHWHGDKLAENLALLTGHR